MERTAVNRVPGFAEERVVGSDHPRTLGEALQGSSLEGLWRYRVEEDRVIVRIEDDIPRRLAVQIGHRREICR